MPVSCLMLIGGKTEILLILRRDQPCIDLRIIKVIMKKKPSKNVLGIQFDS
jgi:hypothetical protein